MSLGGREVTLECGSDILEGLGLDAVCDDFNAAGRRVQNIRRSPPNRFIQRNLRWKVGFLIMPSIRKGLFPHFLASYKYHTTVLQK